jgi:hypothetical protein
LFCVSWRIGDEIAIAIAVSFVEIAARTVLRACRTGRAGAKNQSGDT